MLLPEHVVSDLQRISECFDRVLDGILGAGGRGALLRDEQMILSIVGQLTYRYRIDRRNVLITGFSGGGFPVYFVGLRHPDVFTAIAPRNCNFNANSIHGWYPPEARNTPIKVYYGQNDPGAIRGQSAKAIRYLRDNGFRVVETEVLPGAGHERHPEVAMRFFLRHLRQAKPSL